jgi:signal transduction histidine kinase
MTILFILGMIILLRWLVKPLEIMAQSVSLFNNPQQMINFQRYDTKEIMLLGTAINRMQARMAKLIEQRTYALAAISHDLKTPLTRMRMRLEYITTKKLQHSLLQDLTEMEQMVDSTLYYIKSGKNSEQKQIIDIASILETINNEMADSGLKAAFKKQYEGKLRVFGQHYSLKRALNNIIYNAVKYGEEASITLSRHENSIIICVEDKGKGIDPAQFANVFEPFVRLEQSRNSKTGGFGLGLTIAKTIIENHQGTITLSLNEACSLKVLITLPLHVK